MAEKEYIEREAIQKRLNRIVEVNNLRTDLAWFTPYGVNALIEEIPAADVRPVARGRWIEFPAALAYKDAYCDTHIVCSACEAVFDIMDNDTERFNFCPNCGAMMGVSFDG